MDSVSSVLREVRQQIHRMNDGFSGLQLEVPTLFPTEKITTTTPQLLHPKLPPKCVNAPHDIAASKAGKHDLRRTGVFFMLPCSS